MTGPRKWQFPRDHGGHEAFPSEWWYAAGLINQCDESFGYHIAQFRIENQFHSHFSIYHIELGKFEFVESVHPKSCLEVLDDNELLFRPEFGGDEMEIFLEPNSQILLQGDQGYAIKSARPGHASHYYSIPSMKTCMRIKDVGEFKGRSWFDHEFGTNLKPKECGWIFFFAWMDDGTTVNGYLMKDHGRIDLNYSKLISINQDGSIDKLEIQSVSENPLIVIASGTVFKITIPDKAPTIKSRLSNYLELPCVVENCETFGRGYIEMTG